MGQEREGGRGGEPNPILVPLGVVARRMTAMVERETGLGAGQWFHLVALGRRDGLSQAEIARTYGVDPAQVTRIGQALEREGLVRRERDPEDKRVVRMYLTESGREALERRPEVNERMDRRIREVMSGKEIEEMRRMLDLLLEATEE